jgi:3-methyladenine DNA glycosylase/8-oxoguanine DNA glycosylase
VTFACRTTIPTPDDFDFWLTAYSHGWCDLPPFSFNAENRHLQRVLTLDDGTTVLALLAGSVHSVSVLATSLRRLTAPRRQMMLRQLRTCLRMDEDFTPFHLTAQRFPRYRWIARAHAGRLLRAPTVFEDTVKMICTTNCTWALTKVMVTRLVETFGDRYGDGLYGFPQPATIAASSESVLRSTCKTGYRAPYILALAQDVASGKLPIEQWRSSTLTTEELFRQLLTVKGVGPYAAGNILKLLGRYDELGLDSWVRSQYARIHHKGRRVKDSTIQKAYARLGPWRGLFFWLEMTRDWHPDKFALEKRKSPIRLPEGALRPETPGKTNPRDMSQPPVLQRPAANPEGPGAGARSHPSAEQ